MALIKCNECGKEFSDKADICPKCGCPIKLSKENTQKNNEEKPIKKENKKSILIIGCILFTLIIGISIFLFIKHNNKSYIGKWEQSIILKRGNKILDESYASFEFFKNGTFNYIGYNKNSDDKVNYNGTYNENKGIIYLYITYENEEYSDILYINDGKMCLRYKNCEEYFVKSSSKDKKTFIINGEADYISYEDYQNILSNSEDAIVVFVRDVCHYCEEYKEILKEVSSNYTTPIYFYELEDDDILNISGTPTTYVIKNGVNVETIEGKTEYNELSKILNKNNID